jgi:exodeoxyribonuclease V gamma subunit
MSWPSASISSGSASAFAGPVNICTLMPMRSIPFKVVCLLGMNDGVYPRTLAPLGFDLMSQKPQRGDRSRRDDDRYLFLEALMSAEQTLYISYIGRSIQDNSERFPSVLVQELVDYIGQSHCLAGDEELDCDASEARVKAHITHLHTRMPFDAANFQEDENKSYAREWLAAAGQQGEAHSDFIQPLTAPPIDSLPFDSCCASGSTRYARSFSSACGSISAPKRRYSRRRAVHP